MNKLYLSIGRFDPKKIPKEMSIFVPPRFENGGGNNSQKKNVLHCPLSYQIISN